MEREIRLISSEKKKKNPTVSDSVESLHETKTEISVVRLNKIEIMANFDKI